MDIVKESETVIPTTRHVTAYHEAGHAVCHLRLLKRKFIQVTIKPGQGYDGILLFQPYKGDPTKLAANETRFRSRLEATIMTMIGGLEGERLLHGRENKGGAKSDIDMSLEILTAYTMGDKDEAQAYLQWLQIRTRRWLAHPYNWFLVEAIASFLIKKETLFYDTVKEIKTISDVIFDSLSDDQVARYLIDKQNHREHVKNTYADILLHGYDYT